MESRSPSDRNLMPPRQAEMQTISFRTDAKKVKALDALASMQDRDRSYLLNQAVDNYLDLQQYHIKLIEKGIRQADAGELVDHRDVEKIVAKLQRKK
jgi:RHH-type rel operon transcriptional repressor/antitoxin RelB